MIKSFVLLAADIRDSGVYRSLSCGDWSPRVINTAINIIQEIPLDFIEIDKNRSVIHTAERKLEKDGNLGIRNHLGVFHSYYKEVEPILGVKYKHKDDLGMDVCDNIRAIIHFISEIAPIESVLMSTLHFEMDRFQANRQALIKTLPKYPMDAVDLKELSDKALLRARNGYIIQTLDPDASPSQKLITEWDDESKSRGFEVGSTRTFEKDGVIVAIQEDIGERPLNTYW